MSETISACSFCGADRKTARYLFANGNECAICEHCVLAAVEVALTSARTFDITETGERSDHEERKLADIAIGDLDHTLAIFRKRALEIGDDQAFELVFFEAEGLLKNLKERRAALLSRGEG